MEKRRKKRLVKRLAVNFGVDKTSHTGITNDVSETGLFIRTTKIYPPGSIITINLLIPNNGSVEFKGRVVRTFTHPPFSSLANNGVGVEVQEPEPGYLTYILSEPG